MIILNNTLHLIHVGPEISLKPGANELGTDKSIADAWKDAKTLPVVKSLMEDKKLVEKETDITAWPIAEFKVAVEAMVDVKALAALEAKVTDPAKKKAVADQIAYLTKK